MNLDTGLPAYVPCRSSLVSSRARTASPPRGRHRGELESVVRAEAGQLSPFRPPEQLEAGDEVLVVARHEREVDRALEVAVAERHGAAPCRELATAGELGTVP